MHKNLLFLVSTEADKGNADRRSEVNAHIATCAHEKRRKATGQQKKTPRRPIAHRIQLEIRSFDTQLALPTAEDGGLEGAKISKLTSQDRLLCTPDVFGSESNWHTRQIDQQLISPLDPFLKLPVKVSRYEKHLIHLYLTEFRRLPNNTSYRPRYCPTLEFAFRLLETNQVYIYTHIAISEFIIAGQAKRKISSSFYHGRARSYSAMSELLSKGADSTDDKMLAFAQIALMEWITGNADLNKKHVQAMDLYLQGHVSEFLATLRNCPHTFEPVLYVCPFVLAPLVTPTADMFSEVSKRFIDDLASMRDWSKLSSISSRSRAETMTSLAPHGQEMLTKVRNYSEWLLQECLQGFAWSSMMSASMWFLHNLCISQARYNYDTTESYLFLQEVGMCMEQSETKSNDIESLESLEQLGKLSLLNPMAGTCMQGYIRSKLLPNHREIEGDICQASIDMVRMLPLLHHSTRLHLGRVWLSYAFEPVDQTGVIWEYFNDGYLSQLTREMSASWVQKYSSSKSG